MKKLLPIVFLLLSLHLMAQKSDHHERIKTLKIAFISEKLDLSQKEAQEFWPVYNEYEEKTSKIKYRELRAIRKETKENISEMSNEKASELLQRINEAENNLYQLRRDYSKDLSEIISPKKIILLKIAEDDFKRKMFEEFKKRKKERN